MVPALARVKMPSFRRFRLRIHSTDQRDSVTGQNGVLEHSTSCKWPQTGRWTSPPNARDVTDGGGGYKPVASFSDGKSLD